MKALQTILLLVLSNTFMTLAWYGHLRFKASEAHPGWRALLWIILLSWGIALFEYCFQVPANRIGFRGTGGPFDLFQLKVIQEVLSLLVFTVFALLVFRSESLRWNHLLAFLCLIAAVWLVFKK